MRYCKMLLLVIHSRSEFIQIDCNTRKRKSGQEKLGRVSLDIRKTFFNLVVSIIWD